MKTEDVEKAAAADTSGLIKALVERFESSTEKLVKAFNDKTSALAILLQKSLEDQSEMSKQLQELAEAPIANPKGTSTILEKSFVGSNGKLETAQQQQRQSKPEADLSKPQIKKGFALMIDDLGGRLQRDPYNKSLKRELRNLDVHASDFDLTNRINKSMKAQVAKTLKEHGYI